MSFVWGRMGWARESQPPPLMAQHAVIHTPYCIPPHHNNQVYGQGKSPKIVAFDCGMKFNIVRYFVKTHNVQFTVVPYDYDLKVRAL